MRKTQTRQSCEEAMAGNRPSGSSMWLEYVLCDLESRLWNKRNFTSFSKIINLLPYPPITEMSLYQKVTHLFPRLSQGNSLCVPRNDYADFPSASSLALPPNHSHWSQKGLWDQLLLLVTAIIPSGLGHQGGDSFLLCPAWLQAQA